MVKDYSQTPFHELRRSDRGTSEAWIKTFLRQVPYGVLATTQGDQPFINSNLFVYDEARHSIYMHTAQIGRTRANVEAGGPVCFHASEMGRLLPAAEALEFSVEYAGVTVFGEASLLEDDSEKEVALQMLLDRYFPHLRPGVDYRAITSEELDRTAVYRIAVHSWSGKQKSVGPDFPGAFIYASHSPPTSEEGEPRA